MPSRAKAAGPRAGRILRYALILALLLGAERAYAQDGIYNASVTDSTFEFSPPNTAFSSAVNAIGLDASSFPVSSLLARYAMNINADASDGFGNTKTVNASLVLKFEVHSAQSYELLVGVALAGDLTRLVDDFECTARADVSGVSGFSSQLVTGGRLDIDDPGELASGSADAEFEFHPTTEARIRVRKPQPTEFHTLQFDFSAVVASASCEVAARLGEGNATTQDCAVCGYPGVPPRTPEQDGLFVSVQYLPLDCGNGRLDAGEECDLGDDVNGSGACCDVDCTFKADGETCTDGLFCNGDDRCDGAGICAHPFGTPCQMGPQGNLCFGVCDEGTDSCDFSTCFATPPPTATAPPPATASAIPTPTLIPASCPLPYNAASLNVNGANCVFCEQLGGGQCSSSCIGPEACFCPPPDEPGNADCCAARPCCIGCPATTSPECNFNTCTCNPDIDACCKTVCPCAGDCNGDGGVTVNELVKGVRIARGDSIVAECVSFHPSREGSVDTADIVRGVDIALTGCNAAP